MDLRAGQCVSVVLRTFEEIRPLLALKKDRQSCTQELFLGTTKIQPLFPVLGERVYLSKENQALVVERGNYRRTFATLDPQLYAADSKVDLANKVAISVKHWSEKIEIRGDGSVVVGCRELGVSDTRKVYEALCKIFQPLDSLKEKTPPATEGVAKKKNRRRPA